MERRQKSGVASGRPSGTDGFDYSYRMTVDQRYQKVALRKAQLYRLILCQVAFQAWGILWVALAILKGKEVNKIALLSITAGIIAIISGKSGHRRSSSKLLNVYITFSTFSTVLSVALGYSGHFFGEFIKDSNQNQDEDSLMNLFDFLETCWILAGVLVQITSTLATVSLLNNMSTKRVS